MDIVLADYSQESPPPYANWWLPARIAMVPLIVFYVYTAFSLLTAIKRRSGSGKLES